MKRIHPEDPRVTAYALGELPEHQEMAVRRAAEDDPAVRAALEESNALADLLRAGFQAERHELGEARREAIRRAGRQPRAENLVSLQPRRRDWVRPVLVAGAAAALMACAIWMLQQIPVEGDPLVEERVVPEGELREEIRMQILMSSTPRPARVIVGSASLPRAPRIPLLEEAVEASPDLVEEEYAMLHQLKQLDPEAFSRRVVEMAQSASVPDLAKIPFEPDNPFVSTREEARSSVPLVAGTASYHLVRRFVLTENKLPPRNGVRVEELINQVSYEDAEDASLEEVKVGVELARCPWDETSILMGVLLQNGSEEALSPEAVLQIEVKSDFIKSYRLLGYAGEPRTGEALEQPGEVLAPGSSNFVLYQLQSLTSEVFESHRVVARVGLKLRDDHPRGLIVPATSPPRDWANASNNLQTAVSLGAWGMMLRASPYAGQLSGGMLETLAKEALLGAAEDASERREALQLILDSLPLLAEAASLSGRGE